jgi:hypothetical protein
VGNIQKASLDAKVQLRKAKVAKVLYLTVYYDDDNDDDDYGGGGDSNNIL